MAHPEAAEDSGGGNAMSWNGFNEIAPVVRSAQAKKPPSCPPESEEQKALFDWWKRTPYARHFVMYQIGRAHV